MKNVTKEDLSKVMPLFEKVSNVLNNDTDIFKLRDSLSKGLITNRVYIITNDDYSKMMYGKLLNSEIMNSEKGVGIFSYWTDNDSDNWLHLALTSIVKQARSRKAESVYFGLSHNSKMEAKIPSLIWDIIKPYETAHKVVI